MNQYGADAVRFTLAQLAAQGRDVILSHDRFAASRAFANKIWNAARFVMMNLEGAPQPLPKVEIAKLGLAERWILSRLDATIREVSGSIDVFEFNVAAMKLYDFTWHEFCDWYIELSKEPLKASGERQAGARWVLINVFDRMLRVLHPFMPFVSEEIWQVIRPYLDEPNLAPHLPIAKYPEPSATNPLSAEEELAMNHCIEATEAINSLRSLLGWHPGQLVNGAVIQHESLDDTWFWTKYAMVLGRLGSLATTKNPEGRNVFIHLAWADIGIAVPLDFDYQRTRQKLKKDLAEAQKHATQHEARLNDPMFMQKADPETVENVSTRFQELKAHSTRLQQQLQQLDAAVQ
jgi:valyl-tRNA synthetase